MKTEVKRPAGLTEAQMNQVWHLVNSSIHELVYAHQHLEQTMPSCDPTDEITDARKCLAQVWLNVQGVMEIMDTAIKTRNRNSKITNRES